MDFLANGDKERAAMLAALGIESIDTLFSAVPRELWREAMAGDDGMAESEGLHLLETLGRQNSYPAYDAYLGAGAYDHYVPACVGAICSKSEFLTAYTPYQPEVSQGLLQAIFEFQSAICALTGLDVANASVYDGAAACAEAALMALRLRPERRVVLVAETLHPHYKAVVEQYLRHSGATLITIPAADHGLIEVETLRAQLSDQVAALLLQSPNFWGLLEDSKALFDIVHEAGALALVCANPLAYGLFASAAEMGADIAIGDCQPLGMPLQFGGPYAGYMACRQEFVRQLPGRLVGATLDQDGQTGFVLTLQAREQHIRREKAASNICTNQALAALASLVAMVWYGPQGMHELALTNYQRAAYLHQHLDTLPGITVSASHRFFNEFVVTFSRPLDEVEAHFEKAGILPGIRLDRWYPHQRGSLLVCVTETKTLAQLDRYLAVAAQLL